MTTRLILEQKPSGWRILDSHTGGRITSLTKDEMKELVRLLNEALALP